MILEFINSWKEKHVNINKMIMKNYFNHGMNLKIINSQNEKYATELSYIMLHK